MRILICDDEKPYLDILNAHVQEYMRTHFISCKIETATCPLKILQGSDVFDLAFLDIQMDGMNGIELAKELRRRNGKLALFFVTNFDAYQDDAMDLQAFRFFKKPFDTLRLYAGLDKALEYIDGAYVNVFLSTSGQQQRILVDDILYITRLNRKILLVTKGDQLYTRESMEEWLEKLPQSFFFQVHKSFLVNLHYVVKYSYSELILEGNIRVPIAPSKQTVFRRYWFAYLGGRHI